MDTISCLPIELISSVTSYLDFLSVHWLARASKRTKYLVENGVSSLSLGGTVITYFESLNAANRYRGLKYLRLVDCHRVGKPQRPITPQQLEMLPSGLRMLYIHMRGTQNILNEMILSLPRRLETLGLTLELNANEIRVTLQISAFPPSLTSLSIKSNFKWRINAEEGESLPNLELLKLGWNLKPKTVKTFASIAPSLTALISQDYGGKTVEIESYPPNLTLLSRNQGRWTPENLNRLPSKLLVLEAPSHAIPLSSFEHLPRSLTRVITTNTELKSMFEAQKYDKTATEFAISFPRTRDMLYQSIESYMHEPLSEYPTIEERMVHEDFCILNPTFLRDSLPPNLTSLYLLRINGYYTPADFPPTLTKLCLQHSDTSDFSGLPRQLLHLEVNQLLKLDSCLPPKLHTLKIWDYKRDLINKQSAHTILFTYTADTGQNAANVNSVLPKTLTHFTSAYKCFPHLSWIPSSVTELSLHYLNNVILLEDDLRNLKSIDFGTNESLNDSVMDLLAPDLHTLKLSWNNQISPSGLQKLPTTLTILDLEWNQKAVQDSSASYLPRTLTKLNISCSSLLTHTGIALLPPQLTELQWDRCPHLCELAFAALPRAITLLTLNQHPNIPTSGFKYMPNAIKHLEMAGSKKFEKLEDFQFLPRSITYLDLKSFQDIDGDTCLRLPRQLTHLNLLSATKLKPTDLWKTGLPKSLILPQLSPQSETFVGKYAQYFSGKFAEKIAF